MKRWAKIAGLGAFGLVAAAVLGALALQLVSQPVGLSSEPFTAGDILAPAEPVEDGRGGTGAAAKTPEKSSSPDTGSAPAAEPAPADKTSGPAEARPNPNDSHDHDSGDDSKHGDQPDGEQHDDD